MSRPRSIGVWIALTVFVVVAAAIRLFGEPIYQALIRMHGGGGGGH